MFSVDFFFSKRDNDLHKLWCTDSSPVEGVDMDTQPNHIDLSAIIQLFPDLQAIQLCYQVSRTLTNVSVNVPRHCNFKWTEADFFEVIRPRLLLLMFTSGFFLIIILLGWFLIILLASFRLSFELRENIHNSGAHTRGKWENVPTECFHILLKQYWLEDFT